MSDADEDIIRPMSPSGSVSDGDDEAATSFPDYSAFAAATTAPSSLDLLTLFPNQPNLASIRSSALPRRGLKDFESNATRAQVAALTNSRDAMHTALCHTRTHHPRSRVPAVYDDRNGLTYVRQPRGSMFKALGRDLRGGGIELKAEEALWALERGSLDVRFRIGAFMDESDSEQINVRDWREECARSEKEGLPMSLEAAYAVYLGGELERHTGLTAEKYAVYAGLKRSGFYVLRAEGFGGHKFIHSASKSVDAAHQHPEQNTKDTQSSPPFFAWLYSRLSGSPDQSAKAQEHDRLKDGPLVTPGLYRSYKDIYRLVALNSNSNRVAATSSLAYTSADTSVETFYTTAFDIYHATPHFRKTDPGPPAFRVCVVSAREDRLPTLNEVQRLLDEQADAPSKNGQSPSITGTPKSNQSSKADRPLGATYAAIKRGHRNVLLAIVDEGIVSYIRIAEAPFASEGRLFEKDWSVGASGGGGKGARRGRGDRGRRGRGP